jgi:valyl-tRNA synthetase
MHAKETSLRVLVHILDTSLRLLHPFMPFVTEEIWQHLPHQGSTIMLARWPEADPALIDPSSEETMNTLMDMVRGIRNVRSEYNVDPGRRIKAQIAPGSFTDAIDQYRYIFSRLCNVDEIQLIDHAAAAEDSASVVVSDAVIRLPLAGLVDIAAECQRLSQEGDKLQQGIERSENILANENFVSKAKPEVVDRERKNLADLQASLTQIQQRLETLCG